MREKIGPEHQEQSGTTAVCAMITPTHMILVNLGKI